MGPRVAPMPPFTLGPIIGGVEQDSKDRSVLTAVDGVEVAEIRSAPRLLAQVTLRRIRAAARGERPAPRLLARAAEIYAHGTIGGDDRARHIERVVRAVGLPRAVVELAVDDLTGVLRDSARLNARDVPAPSDGPGGRTVWAPCGTLFASVASLGKHPGPNRAWLRALALGYSVLIRPGARDPFTAHRLVHALLQAGLPPEQATLLPGDDEMAGLLLREADRSLVFGVEERLRPWLTVRGIDVHCEGRSKVLIDREPDEADLKFLADAVAGEAGVRCDNASVILTTGDPVELADRLAAVLAVRPALTVTEPAAAVPAVPAAQLGMLRTRLAGLAEGLTDHTGKRYGGDALTELPDGSYAVRPTVLSGADWRHPSVGTELPLPFVVVVPWSPADGLEPLRDSLVLTLLGDAVDPAVIAADASVRQVVCGRVLPWEAGEELADHVLGLLLMEPKHLVGAGGAA